MTSLCCPQCGAPAKFRAVVTDGRATRYVATCSRVLLDCTSASFGTGRTEEKAHDQFVRACEAKGRTAHLEARLAALSSADRA